MSIKPVLLTLDGSQCRRTSVYSSQSPDRGQSGFYLTPTPLPETIVQKMIGTLCWWEDKTHCKIQDAICQPEGKVFTNIQN